MNVHEASRFLGSLRKGDPVNVTVDGREHAVTVQREHHGEDAGCGSWDHGWKTTVGFGPGRWNVELSAAAIAAGRFTVSRPEDGPVPEGYSAAGMGE
jgi:hypothetical protein